MSNIIDIFDIQLNEEPEEGGSEGSEEFYEPRLTWDHVLYADTVEVEVDLKMASRRQASFDSDPESFQSETILRSSHWVGDCREMG